VRVRVVRSRRDHVLTADGNTRTALVMPGRPTSLYRLLLDGAAPTVRAGSASGDFHREKGTLC
jgi:hypothetical protein